MDRATPPAGPVLL